jgi:VWFA-related protein
VFRAGIELVSVDVTALDSNGRQIKDLTPKDFIVEVDGDARQVISAEYVRLYDPLRAVSRPASAPAVPARDATFFSSNQKDAPSGRLIVLLVDQGNIRTGAARPAMYSAKQFVDKLQPEDRVAVMAVPPPGEMVDFTTDHDKVREALLRIVGAAQPLKVRFNLSITEAFAIYMRNDIQLAADTILRECAAALSAFEAERCEREVEQDAAEIVSEVRHRTDNSVRSMRRVLEGLAAIDGPKSVVLVSEGLVLESVSGEADDLATVAADSRVSLDVLLLDVPRFEASQATRPTTPKEDRDMQVGGLEALAGATRGNLYRINTTAEYAFDRITRSLEGYYLLGVEARLADRNGQRHRISVKSARRGVTIQSRRTFLTSVSAKAATPTEAVTRALRAPLLINDLPLKVTSWTYKEPGSGRLRVLIGAEVERLADQPLEYTTGIMLVNRDNRGVMPAVERRTLTMKDGEPGTAVFSGAMAVEPGTYLLRVAMSDSEGRVGSVERTIDAWHMDPASVALGDLIVSGVDPAARRPIVPVIEPVVTTGRMAALAEVYGPGDALGGMEVALDILTNEDRPPLASQRMTVTPGTSPEILEARAELDTAVLPPGRYLARTTIRQGAKVHGHLLRPFRVEPAALAADLSAEGSPKAEPGTTAVPAAVRSLPPDMALALVSALPALDGRELLAPAALSAAFAVADARAGGSAAALKQARAGALGEAAMTALGDGDQGLAAFIKGLDLLRQSQIDRAAMQFQTAVQLMPTFAPARAYFGLALAGANRHNEAASLLQGALGWSAAGASLPRLAGETWMKAGQPGLAIEPLEQAAKLDAADDRTRKLLGLAYVLGNRPGEGAGLLAPYLERNPADQAALVAAVYATYARHVPSPARDTLGADRDRVARWATAYAKSGGPLQPLVSAWAKYVQEIK